MSEAYIHDIIPQRINELGYKKCYERYCDFLLETDSVMKINAYNELYYIIDEPAQIIVESDYGVFDTTTDSATFESVHEHRGEITIRNPSNLRRRVKFIRVIIVS
jgi:hypothetical protein